MKRSISVLLAVIVLLCCAGCAKIGATDKDEETNDKIVFSATDVNGGKVESKDIFAENKITMINIWASWCGPCVSELSDLQKLSQELENVGCGLIGVLDDGDTASGRETGTKLLTDGGITYLNILSDSAVRLQFSYMYYPTSFFVDSSGRLLGEPIIGAQVNEYLPHVIKLLEDIDN